MSEQNARPTKVVTSKRIRFSYPHIFEPAASVPGSTPKYSMSLIIPKDDEYTLSKVRAAIKAAYEEGQAKLKGSSKSVPPLSAIRTPLRDGDVDKPDDPAYANSYFLNANSTQKPGIVDKDLNPILDKEDFWAGCTGRCSLVFFAYNANNTSRGIGCGLQNVQKIADGEPLGGRSSAENDFATDDEDFLN